MIARLQEGELGIDAGGAAAHTPAGGDAGVEPCSRHRAGVRTGGRLAAPAAGRCRSGGWQRRATGGGASAPCPGGSSYAWRCLKSAGSSQHARKPHLLDLNTLRGSLAGLRLRAEPLHSAGLAYWAVLARRGAPGPCAWAASAAAGSGRRLGPAAVRDWRPGPCAAGAGDAAHYSRRQCLCGPGPKGAGPPVTLAQWELVRWCI